jgi:hypothetical protein
MQTKMTPPDPPTTTTPPPHSHPTKDKMLKDPGQQAKMVMANMA